MHLAYGIPIFDPRLLRAKNGAPGLTPAMGSPTLVWAGAIEPPSAGGGALGVLLPPMKGSLPAGMGMLISPQLLQPQPNAVKKYNGEDTRSR